MIRVVRAGVLLEGDVSCPSCHIGSVRVSNPSLAPDAHGIRGNITVENASIDLISSTGDIGSTTLSLISARRIGAIACVDESGLRTNADIRANIFPQLASVPNGQQGVQYVTTGGDLYGSISGGVIGARLDYTPSRQGVIVEGNIYANIFVSRVDQADIVAKNIYGQIEAQSYQGSIYALGESSPDNSIPGGHIESVIIGPASFLPGSVPSAFIGANVGDPEQYDYGRWLAADSFPGEVGHLDSIIRGATAGIISIAGMTVVTTDQYGFPLYTVLAPRVEVPQIESLSIEKMAVGSVWSGAHQAADDPSDNYASVGTLHLGCVGPFAQVWIKDTIDTRIQGNLRGTLTLSVLKNTQTITIGLGLPDYEGQSCECTYRVQPGGACAAEAGVYIEGSPRSNTDFPPYFAGAVRIGQRFDGSVGSLNGQIILHAANSGSSQDTSKWQGNIIVGAFTSTELRFNTDAQTSEQFRGPFYQAIPGTPGGFGSGAIGLVPLAIHRQASELDPGCNASPNLAAPTRLQFSRFNRTDACGLEALDIVFYGPVQRPTPAAPLDILMEVLDENLVCQPTLNATNAVAYAFSDQSRRVKISALSGNSFPGPRNTASPLAANPATRMRTASAARGCSAAQSCCPWT